MRPSVIYDYRDESLRAQEIPRWLARQIAEKNARELELQIERDRHRALWWIGVACVIAGAVVAVGAWVAL